ncbi:hypothetical protein SLS62_002673 [Diatrype stigma]|uniref:NADPH--cytochrome P450 reductase n=1 Tax=Diatrype stigma TaxID=117547 RepID=A0AAN9UUB5_9PEZI
MEFPHFKHRALHGDGLKLLGQAAPSSFVDALAVATISLLLSAYALRGYVWDRPNPYQHLWFERPQAADAEHASGKTTTRNIAEKAQELGKDVIVFWGSQSGTAEGFAASLAQDLHRHFQLEVMAVDLSDYDPDSISLLDRTKIAIFILSTYGEGDPSDNASIFCDWLTRTKESSLSSLRYAAFGLGNSDYQHYNRVVDQVAAGLQRCGAESLMSVGKADARRGTTEEDFFTWKESLYNVLREQLGFAESSRDSLAAQYQPTLKVVEDDSLDLADLHDGNPVHGVDGGKPGANSPIKGLMIKQSRELFQSSSRNCLHIEFDISNVPELTYKTGDHLAIWPINPDQEVDRLVALLGFSERRATPILISSLDAAIKVKIPSPTSIDALFRYYLEVGAPVSRATVQGLANFAPSPAIKDFLFNLSRDRDVFAEFTSRTHVTVGRLLELALKVDSDVSTWQDLPLSYLVEILPRSQPRYYSISSSSITSPRSPTITVLVANTELSAVNPPVVSIPGLASNYLLSLSGSQGATIGSEKLTYALSGPSGALAGGLAHAHIRRSKFKLPALSSCPIIMVAAGTGLAPFRAFVIERARLRMIGKPVGKMLLVFGCRRPDEDYIYRDELEQASQSLGDCFQIVTAFSRAPETPKAYVQDRVRELDTEISGLIGDDASVYICGRASMAREVGKAMGEIIRAERGWEEGETLDWSGRMKRARKWQEDVWG